MPRPSSITKKQRDRYNRARRKRWAERSRRDPEWKARQLENRAAWDKAKVARCPEYAELMQLRKDKVRLRDSAKHHQDMLQKRETELLDVVAKIDERARKCWGK